MTPAFPPLLWGRRISYFYHWLVRSYDSAVSLWLLKTVGSTVDRPSLAVASSPRGLVTPACPLASQKASAAWGLSAHGEYSSRRSWFLLFIRSLLLTVCLSVTQTVSVSLSLPFPASKYVLLSVMVRGVSISPVLFYSGRCHNNRIWVTVVWREHHHFILL